MNSSRATRALGSRARWFVRAAAVIVGLINLRALVWAFGRPSGGNGSWLLGTGVSFSEALPSILAVSVAALATSEVVVRRYGREIAAEEYALRYAAAFRALCVGGALAGAMLAGLWIVDGTIGADSLAGDFTSPPRWIDIVVGFLPTAALGAGVGLGFGFVEGKILAFPLAVALERFGGGGDSGEAGPVRPSGAA